MCRPIAHMSPTFESLETRKLLSAVDLDPNFGDDGKVRTDLGLDGAMAVAVLPGGKILVAAGSDQGSAINLVRYNADGSLDPSFGGGDGVVSENLGHEFIDASDVA